MQIRFSEAARQELKESVDYYNTQRPGLGQEFLTDVESAIEKILLMPKAWAPLDKDIRRCRTKRFPFGLIYRLKQDEILIVAVAHLHRRPGYWEERH